MRNWTYESILWKSFASGLLNPISINDADAEVLQAANLLNPTQIRKAYYYRNEIWSLHLAL